MKRFIMLTAMVSPLLFSVRETAAQSQIVPSIDNHTAREEAEGQTIWGKLKTGELACEALSDDEFGALGEYFMGLMVGDSHEAMNSMMENMMGKESEEQMHVVMGKRFSGCDTTAAVPQQGGGFMPMMLGMMRGGGNPAFTLNGVEGTGTGWNMMGGWNGFGVLGWMPMILFWIILVLGIVALLRYLRGSSNKSGDSKSPLDILKERYARGEIDRKEFDQMKKELV